MIPGTNLLLLMELPLALECLTAVFGMGTGVSTLSKAPGIIFSILTRLKSVNNRGEKKTNDGCCHY